MIPSTVPTRTPADADRPDGNALVYCEGAFGTSNGKTAHGLVRRTRRYRVLGIIDSGLAGRDAGEVLDGRPAGIPIYARLHEALQACRARGTPATHLVLGLAPDGGRLPPAARADVAEAVRRGLNVDNGLHDFLSEDPEIAALAASHGVTLRDVRRPPPRDLLHFFTGAIERVRSFRVAVLGTDSAVGKRTTAWILVEGLCRRGISAELIGTGQTSWMQGARYSVIFDSLVNDFVTGEIEHAVVTCDRELQPQVMVLEGQGSLMNPAYPGGFEILAAARPDLVVLQHAPARRAYDGFPGYAIHPLPVQIQAVELIGGKPVVAVTVNHEGIAPAGVAEACRQVAQEGGRPAMDVLLQGQDPLLEVILPHLQRHEERDSA